MALKKKLKVGNKVMWKGSWGSEPAREAKVTGLERVKVGQKEGGKEVDSVKWERILTNGRTVIVSLDNGHWAYGDQISRMPEKGEN